MSELEWIPSVEKFAASDVVRWTWPQWPEKRRKKKGKVLPLGEHRTTAEVLDLDSRDYVRLLVIKDEIVKNPHGMPLKLLKKGEIIVRKRDTLMRGKAQRIKSTDEAVRAIEVSKFLT
jgi:hypothetical protein